MTQEILLILSDTLNILSDDIVNAENPERLYFSANVLVRDIGLLTQEIIQELITQYGHSIKLEVGPEGLESDIVFDSSSSVTSIVDQIDKTKRRYVDEKSLVLALEVDKAQLIRHLGIPLPLETTHYFIFERNLIKFLHRSLSDIDHDIFNGRSLPSTIIVAEGNIKLLGDLFSVISRSNLAVLSNKPSISEHTQQDVETLYNLSTEVNSWISFKLDSITPFHFLFFEDLVPSAENEIENAIVQMLAVSFAIFTANRTIASGNSLEVMYASTDEVVRFTVDKPSEVNEAFYKVIRQLLNWLCGANGRDKMRYFQTVIARDLPENGNITHLLKNLGRYYKDAEWLYSVAIDGKITKHFESFQNASKYVAQATKDIAVSIDTLTKGLNDTLVGAIGVVILSLIAALTGGKTTSFIFTVLMLSYVLYIVLFQIFYRLGITAYSYNILIKETNENVAEYRAVLGEEKIDSITASLRRRKTQYQVSFFITGLSLVIFAALIAWVGILGPTQLHQWGIL
jgi:hypothetical protein